MSNPKLSIITVNLNNTVGLRKTIKSVVGQTYTDFEYIIIDGGSTDGSVEIIKEYAEKITYWESEPDKGIYNAMNKGIKMAKGGFCLFLNSGDVLNNEKIINDVSDQLKFDNDFVYGDIINTYDNIDLQYVKSDIKITLANFEKGSLPHPSTFIKRSLFMDYGLYNEDLKVVSDYEFFLKVFISKPNAFHYINLSISIFEMNGISSDPNYKQLRDEEREATKYKYLPQCVWDELNCQNELRRKYDGLLSSNSIKIALYLSKIISTISK